MVIKSKRFPSIEFETYEYKNENETLYIISHHSLQTAINHMIPVDVNLEYDFGEVQVLGNNHFVIKAWMKDCVCKVVDFGEVTENTLRTDISKDNPVIIARNRAFDRVAIEYLELPGRVYSSVEMPTETDGEISCLFRTHTNEMKSSSSSVRNILKEKRMNMDNVKDIDSTESENSEGTSLEMATNIHEQSLREIEAAAFSDSISDSVPTTPSTDTDEEELGKIVIGFWKYKNSTIEEVFHSNIDDMKWIAQTVKNKPVADKIRRYLNIKNIEWTKK